MSRQPSGFLCLVLLSLPIVFAATPPPPVAPKRPVTDEYHGVKIVDDYRWLENAKDPEVAKWTAGQNVAARAYLDALPMRGALRARLVELLADTAPRFYGLQKRGGVLFALKMQPPKQQPMLVRLSSPDAPESAAVICDPNASDASGGTTIDFYVPSLDGKLVAVSLSQGGSERGSVSVFETATGKRLPDEVPRVNYATAGGSVAWNADASGFYYTRYPRPGERPEADLDFYQQVYYHRLGTQSTQDAYAVGRQFPRIAEIQLSSSDDGKYVLATVANGDGGDFVHFVLGPAGRWAQVTRLADQVSLARFSHDGALYMLSRAGAPMGKLLRLEAPEFNFSKAKTVVTPGRSSLDYFLPTASKLYVHYMAGGPSKLRVTGLQGTPGADVDLPAIATVSEMVAMGGDEILAGMQTYVEPFAWYRLQPGGGLKKTALATRSTADFSDCEVIRQMAVSKDGTRVPVNIMRKKGTKLDGNNPVLLYAYGGYSISVTPGFQPARRIWLDHGGVIAEANLRGGGEFGEAWHEAGKLTRKQNVFDDFQAAAEYLIKMKYTSPEKLAIEGGSNGGLLMGAALTQHPELYRAVVALVGIYDMLRVELSPNGAFNVTEFGTVKEADQFRALLDYSPFHRVKDGTDYPAVLFLTGDNDGRVDPLHSRKMTARLQAATHSGRPVLLRTSASSGHGIGTALDERIEELADIYAWLFDQLGMK